MASYHIFIGGKLLYAYGAARMEFAGGYADLCAKPEFTAISKLSGGVMERDSRIDFF